MLHMLVEAEIQCRVGVRGGDDVPAGAAAAEMVERGEAPGDVIGRVESGRGGGDEADMLGRARERREERERLEGGHRVAALQGLDRHVEHRQMVGHEEGVELARLQLLRQALQQREVEIRIGRGAGIAPGPGMDADRAHEGAELQLSRMCHGNAPRSCGQTVTQQPIARPRLAKRKNPVRIRSVRESGRRPMKTAVLGETPCASLHQAVSTAP